MWLTAIPIIGDIIGKLPGVVDKAVLDKTEAERLKAQLAEELSRLDFGALETQIKAQAQVIAAEAQGQSSLQRNWRPILMLVIVAIVANNYLVAPYLKLMGAKSLVLQLPDRLWDLMTLGVGGYVAGRTIEKSIATWKGGKP